tara:strand:+ start:51 stop:260 length:210 start_codon:yes stop_codon:yes gene_type:complete
MLNSILIIILIIILILIILYNLFNQSFKENLDNNNNNMSYLEIINRLVSHPDIKDKPKEKKLIDFTREN